MGGYRTPRCWIARLEDGFASGFFFFFLSLYLLSLSFSLSVCVCVCVCACGCGERGCSASSTSALQLSTYGPVQVIWFQLQIDICITVAALISFHSLFSAIMHILYHAHPLPRTHAKKNFHSTTEQEGTRDC